MRIKMSKQRPPASTASAVGPCPTIIQIVGRPGTGRTQWTQQGWFNGVQACVPVF